MSSKRASSFADNRPRKQTRSVSILQTSDSAQPFESEQTNEPDSVQNDQDAGEIIMSVEIRDAGTLGCAYYVETEEKLYMMEDVKASDLEMLTTLKVYIEPTCILSSTRSNEKIIDLLRPPIDEDGSQLLQPCVLEIRPSSEFNYQGAKQKLINSGFRLDNVPTMTLNDDGTAGFETGNGLSGAIHPHHPAQSRLIILSTLVDMHSTVTVGCAGAIISYLQRKRSVRFLPGDLEGSLSFWVSYLEPFSLRGHMMISQDTLASLRILESDVHPNAHNQGPTKKSSGAKEGLSIYGLFRKFARTPQGKHRLRQYFLRPSIERQVIGRRLDAISMLIRPENSAIASNLTGCMAKLKNMIGVMSQLKKGILNAPVGRSGINRGVLASLNNFCFQVLKIREFLLELSLTEWLWIYHDLMETFEVQVFSEIGQEISRIVDFQGSSQQRRVVVNPGIDADLDAKKRQYDGMNDLLATITRKISSILDEEIPALNTIYFPKIGFLLAVPIDESTRRGIIDRTSPDDEPWEFKFSNGNTLYYKSAEMMEMDERFGDIQSDICDREIEITVELAQRIIPYEKIIVDSSNLCGELDCLIALSKGAEYYRLSRPDLSDQNIINIQGGRHLLQELVVDSYVPNDLIICGGPGGAEGDTVDSQTNVENGPRKTPEHPSMLLLTGPNFSGKSVFLQQMALIVYLCHVGSFVPAEKAEIGITDKILTRLATRETVSKARSTFLIDLQQILQALTLATCRSLILIDEFGKGTNPHDGAGLACGVFDYLLSLGDDRPKVLAATHFYELIELGYLSPRPELAFGHMEVQIDLREAVAIENQVTYLYNFRPGWSRVSLGTFCAKNNGIDTAIIDRANDLSELIAKGEDLVAACAQISPADEEMLNRAELVVRQFLQQDFPVPRPANGEKPVGIKALLANIVSISTT